MIEPTAMFPVLVTDELGAQKAFYESSFGFEAVFFEPDFYLHLTHRGSGVELGFLVPAHPTQPPFLHPHAVADGMVVTLEVVDAQAALAAAAEAGLDLAMDYKVEPWGQRHFMLRDPAGFVVDIVERQPS